MNSPASRDTLLRLTDEALRLALGLERGQADAPLSLLLQNLQKAAAAPDLRAVLLGFGPSGRVDALGWLAGKEAAPVLEGLLARCDSLTLRLGARQLTLEANGRHHDFDSLPALLQAAALDQATGSVILSLPGAQAMAPLDLLVLPDAERLAREGARISRLALDSHLLIVAAPLAHVFAGAERALLENVDAAFQATWPLLIQTPGDFTLPEGGWWADLLKPRHRAVERLVSPEAPAGSASAQVPPLLADAGNAGRQHLRTLKSSNHLIDACMLMLDQQQQRQRQLSARKERDERQLRQLEQEVQQQGAQRKQWNELKQLLQDGLPDVLRDLNDARRKQKSSTGQLAAQVSQLVSSMRDGDLRQEPGHSVIRLTVHPGFTGRLLGLLRESVNDDCHDYAAQLATRLADLRGQLLQRAQALAPGMALAPVSLDARSVASVLVDMVGLDLRYRGEMPRRGFLDRFKEGRQGAMGFMMLVSLGGTVFGTKSGSPAPWIGPVMGIIFIATIAYSFLGWRKEDEERMERELERVREGVQGELGRLTGEIQRDLQTRFNEQAERLRKQWQKELETAAEDVGRQRQEVLEAERRQHHDRQQATEAQRKDLSGLSAPLQKLLRDTETLLESLEK